MCEKQRKMSERSSLFPILYSFRVYIFIDLPKAVKHHSVREITAESRYHRGRYAPFAKQNEIRLFTKIPQTSVCGICVFFAV